MGRSKKSNEKDMMKENETTEKETQQEKEEKKEDKQDIRSELDKAKDKYLRLFAEFENFKRRSSKERFDLIRTAAQDTIKDLLPVLDDFDRAKKSAEDESSDEYFSEGVNLVYNKLYSVLRSKGLQEMETTGEAFDPEIHEAITEVPAPSEDMKGKVIDTVEKGYYLNDKIIRYPKVVVGK